MMGKRSTGCYDCHFCNKIMLWIACNLCNDMCARYCDCILCCAILIIWNIWYGKSGIQDSSYVHCTYLAKDSINATTTTKSLSIVHLTKRQRWDDEQKMVVDRFDDYQLQSAYLLNECDETHCELKNTYLYKSVGSLHFQCWTFHSTGVSCYQFENFSLWTHLIICCVRCHRNVIF